MNFSSGKTISPGVNVDGQRPTAGYGTRKDRAKLGAQDIA